MEGYAVPSPGAGYAGAVDVAGATIDGRGVEVGVVSSGDGVVALGGTCPIIEAGCIQFRITSPSCNGTTSEITAVAPPGLIRNNSYVPLHL